MSAPVAWRSGYDERQHAAVDPRQASCGEPIREQRYDRPDWPRCVDCIAIEGIVVPAPPTASWTEPEKREAYGR